LVCCHREERLNRGLLKNLCARETNEARLLSRTEKRLCWIWQAGAADEAQADSIGGSCDRDDAVRRALCRPETNDKEIVVVVSEFGRGGKALSQRFACGTNDCLMFWLELTDEILQLFFRIGELGGSEAWHRPNEKEISHG
jgi:hypothetical protein